MKIKSIVGILGVWSAFLAAGTWIAPVAAWSLQIAPVHAMTESPPVELDQQFADEFTALFGVTPSESGLVLSAPAPFDATGRSEVALQETAARLLPRIFTEITESPEIQSHRSPNERVFSVYADVYTSSGVVLAQFLVRSFEDRSEFWFTGIASGAFVDALMSTKEPELRSALSHLAPYLQVNLDGMWDELIPPGSYEGPQPTSDCARLARSIEICRASFAARAREAQSGLMEQLELLGELHRQRIAACDAGYSASLLECAQGRGAAIIAAEGAFASARAAAEDARDIAYESAAQSRSTAIALAVAGELSCIAAAHIGFYACLAAAGWTGLGIPACVASFLALQLVCHAAFVAAVLIIDNAYEDAIALANIAFNQQLLAAAQARDAAILAADQAYADCVNAATAQRDACMDAAGREFLSAACLALQGANAAFREAVIQFRECVAMAQHEFGELCPNPAGIQVTPELGFLEGVGVEGCEFEWPPRLP